MFGRVGVLHMANNKQKRSKYTEDWVANVQAINNGMIVLRNQDKVTGVKIEPRNIFILDEQSQANVLNALKNFYNALNIAKQNNDEINTKKIELKINDIKKVYNAN